MFSTLEMFYDKCKFWFHIGFDLERLCYKYTQRNTDTFHSRSSVTAVFRDKNLTLSSPVMPYGSVSQTFFQVGTTFISQNVLRTTLLLGLSNSLGLP